MVDDFSECFWEHIVSRFNTLQYDTHRKYISIMKLLNRIDNYTSASFVLVWIAFLLSIRARPSPQMISKIE